MHMPGATELFVVALVTLLLFGPRRMPEIGRSVGQALREFRRTSQEVMDTLHGAMNVDDPPPTPANRRTTPSVEEED